MALASGNPPTKSRVVESPHGEEATLNYNAGFLGRDYTEVTLKRSGCCRHIPIFSHNGPSSFDDPQIEWVDNKHLHITFHTRPDDPQHCEQHVGDTVITCTAVSFPEAFPLLIELLEGESDAMVLSSGIAALGHLYNEAAIPIIERYKEHPDQDVRFSVACSLGHFPNDPVAISALIPLTRDPDSEVRDWAVFGLGVQGNVDSSEIREALLQRISDSDEDVREEAALGLGKRQDFRLLPTLRNMLDAPELKVRVAEAAFAMLGMPEDPEEWGTEDYKKALDEKFGRGASHD